MTLHRLQPARSGIIVYLLAAIVIVTLLAASRSAALPDSPPDVQSSGVPQRMPSDVGQVPGSLPVSTERNPAQTGGTLPSPAPASGAGSEGAPAPTSPTPATSSRTGWATWYDDGPGLYGAVHSFRWGDDRYAVQVCAFGGGRTSCVHVIVRDFCACGDRRGVPTVIDLSPAAFRELAPLSRGVIRVEVSGPIVVPLPATDGGS